MKLFKKKQNAAPSGKTDEVFYQRSSRYTDPLILNKIHNLENAYMREIVAEHDPIAGVLTASFAEAATAKMIKFYESDQKDAPEILQDLRALLDQSNFLSILEEVIYYSQIHGWCIVAPQIEFAEGAFKLDCQVYSEYECPPTHIKRINNEITGYEIRILPKLPLSRTANLNQISHYFTPDQVIHVTRGRYNYGFGSSVFEGTWDPLSKLREMSHSDHFRSKVVPFVKIPQDWDDEQVDTFLKALAATDTMNALVMRATEDIEGNPVPDLPAISLDSLASDAKNRSNTGGSPGISDLSSEWARLCGRTRRSVGYFTGGGAISASMAAAEVDSLDDTFYDIVDFNKYIRPFVIPFVRWFAAQIGYPLPESFVAKGWWEWERDEKSREREIQNQKTEQNSEKTRENVRPGVFVPVNSQSGNVELVGVVPAGPNENTDKIYVKFRDPYNWYKYSDPNADVDAITDDIAARGGDAVWDHLRGRDRTPGYPEKSAPGARTHDAQGNRLKYPNAGRGHQVSYMGASAPPGVQEGPPRGIGGDPVLNPPPNRPQTLDEQLAAIPPLGPEFAADLPDPALLQTTEADFAPKRGRPPKVKDIKGGSTRLYVQGRRGRVSVEDFLESAREGERRVRVREAEQRAAANPPEDLTAEDLADIEEPQDTPQRLRRALRRTGRVLRRIAGVGRRLTQNDAVDPNELLHPLLRKWGSINAIRKNEHISPHTVYKILDEPWEATRVNLSGTGNSFSTQNPFRYLENEELTVEYQDPESIKKLIGQTIPIIITHDYCDEELNPIPDCVIGTYTIKGFDENSGKESAEYNIDRERAIAVARATHQDWIVPYLENGQIPETSTAYDCKIKYDRKNSRKVQYDFKLKHLALVPKGNCSSEFCQIALSLDNARAHADNNKTPLDIDSRTD